MTFSITLGWWLVPLILTIGSVIGALKERPSDNGGFFPSLAPLFRLACAAFLSLVAWLVYVTILLVLK